MNQPLAPTPDMRKELGFDLTTMASFGLLMWIVGLGTLTALWGTMSVVCVADMAGSGTVTMPSRASY